MSEDDFLSYQWWVDEAIEDLETDLFGVTAGLGSGKTHGEIQWHFDRCILNREAPFSGFIMPSYQRVKDTALPKWQDYLRSMGYSEGWHYKVNNSAPQTLTLTESGHTINFYSAERPESLVGVELSHTSCDETGSCDADIVTRARERTRHPKAQVHQLMFAGAPQGMNHFAELFDSDRNDGWDRTVERDHRLVRKVLETGEIVRQRRFRVATHDNPFLRTGYLTQLYDSYRHNPALISAYIYGMFMPFAEGLVANNYIPTKHKIKDIDPSPHRDIYLTFDFNANSRLAWIGLQKVTFEEPEGRLRRYVAIKEASANVAYLDDACLDFALQFPRDRFANTPIYIYGDSSGHSGSHKRPGSDYDNVKDYLRRLGFQNVNIRAAKYNPIESESAETLNKAFMNDVLLICESLKRTDRSLMATTWKPGTRNIFKPKDDNWTDYFDALKYFAHEVIKDYRHGKPTRRVLGTNTR